EIVNAAVFANYFAACCDEFTSSVRERLSLIREIRVDEALVVSAGDEADFLRVGLFGQSEPVLAGEIAHFGLGHVPQREEGSGQLFLGQAEEEISLVLAAVSGTLQQPAAAS